MTDIQSTVADFQEEVFKTIQNDYEGEIDEETFASAVDDFHHQELDEIIAYMNYEDVLDIIEEYGGFQHALQNYIDTFGAVKDAPSVQAIAYNIINDEARDRNCFTMKAYKEWCESQ